MDPIDELIEAALKTGPTRPPLEKCNRCQDTWHGLSRPGCQGSWDVEAIQNQGVIDWTES